MLQQCFLFDIKVRPALYFWATMWLRTGEGPFGMKIKNRGPEQDVSRLAKSVVDRSYVIGVHSGKAFTRNRRNALRNTQWSLFQRTRACVRGRTQRATDQQPPVGRGTSSIVHALPWTTQPWLMALPRAGPSLTFPTGVTSLKPTVHVRIW